MADRDSERHASKEVPAELGQPGHVAFPDAIGSDAMVAHASWKGYLKLSLVSCPVALFPAFSSSEKVSFHLLNGETGNRLKQQYVDSETGTVVDKSDRVKGYEVDKGDYVIVTDDELAAVQIESSHTIAIEHFMPASAVDAIYLDNHFYLAPDDKIGAEAFAVIRDAMRKRGMVGIARVVLFGRERMIMVQPRAKGLMLTTLHPAHEVRSDAGSFDDIPDVEIADDLLDLASHIIDTKTAAFDPTTLGDRYQDAVIMLIEAKKAGRPVAIPSLAKPSNVIDLMDALRKSLGQKSQIGSKTDAPTRAIGHKTGASTKTSLKAKAGTKTEMAAKKKTATPIPKSGNAMPRSKAKAATAKAATATGVATKTARRKAI